MKRFNLLYSINDQIIEYRNSVSEKAKMKNKAAIFYKIAALGLLVLTCSIGFMLQFIE